MQSPSSFQALLSFLKGFGKSHKVANRRAFQRAVAAVKQHSRCTGLGEVVVVQGNDLRAQLLRLLRDYTRVTPEMETHLIQRVSLASYTQAQLLDLQREFLASSQPSDRIAGTYLQSEFTGWHSAADHVLLCLTQAANDAARDANLEAARQLHSKVQALRQQQLDHSL